jgi:hypothetical protein
VDKIPLRLRTHVPTIVDRVVQLTLTHALTRSVGSALLLCFSVYLLCSALISRSVRCVDVL